MFGATSEQIRVSVYWYLRLPKFLRCFLAKDIEPNGKHSNNGKVTKSTGKREIMSPGNLGL